MDQPQVGPFLAEHFQRLAEARTPEEKTRVLDRFVEAIEEAELTQPIITRLLRQDENGTRLALEIGSRLKLPVDSKIIELLSPLLGMSDLSSRARMQTTARLLLSSGENSPEAKKILNTLLSDVPRSRAAQRIKRLRNLVPERRDVAELQQELDGKDINYCPHCLARLSKEDLIQHLWTNHHSLLVGDEAKDPWELIEEWASQNQLSNRTEWLSRCFDLAQQIDPRNGLLRLRRILIANGGKETGQQTADLLDQLSPDETICPHCLANIPVGTSSPIPHRLYWESYHESGFRLELIENLFSSRLYLQTPTAVYLDAQEPRSFPSRPAKVLGRILPLTLIALGLSLVLPKLGISALWPVALVLLGSLGLYFLNCRRSDHSSPRGDRLIDYTWSILVPNLHLKDFDELDARFLIDLARGSFGRGNPASRENNLARITAITQDAITQRSVNVDWLTGLILLQLQDARQMQRDVIPFIANQLGFVLRGSLPVRFGEQFLSGLSTDLLQRAERSRLRILILGQAFETGWEVLELRSLGRIMPQFGQLFASEDIDGMARLRWLWQIKGFRPWQTIGPATTVFDLARYPMMAGSYLESNPDLLLFQPLTEGASDSDQLAPILICEEGVVYRQLVLKPKKMEISVKAPTSRRDGFILQIGNQEFPFRTDPSLIASRLRAWTQFLYRDFLPQVSQILERRSMRVLQRIVYQKRILCPECQQPSISVPGEIGLTTEELDSE